MDEAVAFITNFIAQEHSARIASYVERDEQRYAALLDSVNQMYAGDLRDVDINRDGNPDEQWFADGAGYIDKVKPRTLFQVKAHAHRTYGELYRCYLSTHYNWSDTYFASLYVARKAADLRIIARYHIALDHVTWNYRGGERIGRLGALIGLRQFQPPSRPADNAEYLSAAAEFAARAARK